MSILNYKLSYEFDYLTDAQLKQTPSVLFYIPKNEMHQKHNSTKICHPHRIFVFIEYS